MAGLGSTLREEYQFYKMMDSLNVRLAANDKRRPDNPIGLFTVHQVVLLHDKLDELLRQRGDGLGAHMTSNPPRGGRKIDKTFRDALRQTFMECNGINKMRLSDATLDGLIEAWTDAGEEFGKYMTNEARGGDRQDFGQVPISPFDPRFRELSAVKHAGFQPLFGTYNEPVRWGAGEEIRENADHLNLIDSNGQLDMFARVFVWPDGEKTPPPDERRFALTSKYDACGISRLMEFMDTNTYQRVAAHVSNIPYNEFMTPEQMDRAVAIMSYIRDNGYSYEISEDVNPGQLKVRLDGTNVTVRLMDTRNHDRFIGRVSDNGHDLYFSQEGTYNEQTRGEVRGIRTEDCVNLLRYVMGDTIPSFVEQADGTRVYETDHNVGEWRQYYVPRSRGISEQRWETYAPAQDQDSRFSAVMGVRKEKNGSETRLRILMDNNRGRNGRAFYDQESAEAFLREAVRSARSNFELRFDVEGLIRSQIENEEPVYSGDTGIAAIQESVWQYLNGRAKRLAKPGAGRDDFSDLEDVNIDEKPDCYPMVDTIEEKQAQCRQYVQDCLDYYIGTYPGALSDEKDASVLQKNHGKWFNSEFVMAYMVSESFGVQQNEVNIVNALRRLESDEPIAGKLMDSQFHLRRMAGKLAKFDEARSESIQDKIMKGDEFSDFYARLKNEMEDAISHSGCLLVEDSMRIDEKGVLQYKIRRPTSRRVITQSSKTREALEDLTCEIGQIFPISKETGLVRTNFAAGVSELENTPGLDYYIVPGYEAYVLPYDDTAENRRTQTLEARTRLRGYEQVLFNRLKYEVRSTLTEPADQTLTLLSMGDINWAYTHMYGTKHSLNFMQEAKEEGMREDVLEAVLKTEHCRVKYDNLFRNESTTNAAYRAENNLRESLNDNFFNAYNLTGRRDMTILSKEGDGYFDKSATGGSTNQGIVRFLTEGAVVNPDGSITPSPDKNDKTPLLKHEFCRYMDSVPFDRRQMTILNMLSMSCVTEPVGTANMTFGGWTFDDGFVISKEFAEQYKVRGIDDKLRPLVKGDKISDFYGNKGVISVVVDRNMSEEEARAEGLEQVVAWFRANPDMDVVGAPFAAVSRFNAGSAKELSENVEDLQFPDGRVREGCLGHTRFIVTHMNVDAKTHAYGEEAMAQGKGRKASSQLAWALQAQGCDHILKEFYGNNTSAFQNLREYLIFAGMDMDAGGKLEVGYHPHGNEERIVFKEPNLLDFISTSSKTFPFRLNERAARQAFTQAIAQNGGFMELPFPVVSATGELFPEVSQDVNGVDVKPVAYTEAMKTAVGNMDAIFKDSFEKFGSSGKRYLVPVLSSHLRSSMTVFGDTFTTHDYTKRYQDLFVAGLKYRLAEVNFQIMKELVVKNKLDRDHATAAFLENKNNLRTNIRNKEDQTAAIRAGNGAYKNILRDVNTRVFSGKRNIFKEGIMSNRVAKSATAVWTADPRLNLDEIAVSPMLADSLNVQTGDNLIVWRDPILRDAGTRCLKVKVQDGLVGVAINPVMDKCFDGDFDGDSVGIVSLQTQGAKNDATRKLSVYANFLDLAEKDAKTGQSPLFIQSGLDLASARAANGDFKKRWDELTAKANSVEGTPAEMDKIVSEAGELVHAMLKDEYGNSMVSFKSVKDHIRSLESMVLSGAKGSMSKLQDYGKYLGVDIQLKTDEKTGIQRVDYDKLPDAPIYEQKTKAVRKDDNDVQHATAVKAFGTGVAGMYSQRGVSALRNSSIKDVLELTYQVTQSILQSKHDAVEAAQKYKTIMNSARALWRGRVVVEQPVLDAEGKQIDNEMQWVEARPGRQATREEWIDQFTRLYESKNGCNVKVNPDFVKMIADNLCDKSTGLMMNFEDPDVKRRLATPLDQLAYGGSLSTVCELAKKEVNLFDDSQYGKEIGRQMNYNIFFMPTIVAENLKHIKEGQPELVRVVGKSDTRVASVRQVAVREKAAVMAEPKIENVEDIIQQESVVNETEAQQAVIDEIANNMDQSFVDDGMSESFDESQYDPPEEDFDDDCPDF